jgi:hypothetical protein
MIKRTNIRFRENANFLAEFCTSSNVADPDCVHFCVTAVRLD